jgi:hypothetical protein
MRIRTRRVPVHSNGWSCLARLCRRGALHANLADDTSRIFGAEDASDGRSELVEGGDRWNRAEHPRLRVGSPDHPQRSEVRVLGRKVADDASKAGDVSVDTVGDPKMRTEATDADDENQGGADKCQKAGPWVGHNGRRYPAYGASNSANNSLSAFDRSPYTDVALNLP